jgi:hypothetical protein
MTQASDFGGTGIISLQDMSPVGKPVIERPSCMEWRLDRFPRPIATDMLTVGMTRGFLTIIGLDLRPWYLEHDPLRQSCKSPRCILCAPDTARPYMAGTATVRCVCGEITTRNAYRLANGTARRHTMNAYIPVCGDDAEAA